MGATNRVSKALKRIGLMSGVALIAISASAFESSVAAVAAPAPNQQIAEGQQPNSAPQWQTQKHGNNQQNGQGQNHQWGQNGQGQWQQNGQGWNRQWAQQDGQPRYQQRGQGQWQQWGRQGGQQQWGHHYDWSAYYPGRRPPEWDRYRRDFDPRPYEWNRVSEYRYHWEPYVEPPGWYYQRWAYGEILPEIFWSQQYWLTGYAEFGLYDPPYGYVWVRYGNDALLVDVESGQILSVQYGLFYS